MPLDPFTEHEKVMKEFEDVKCRLDKLESGLVRLGYTVVALVIIYFFFK